jgi:hypothetical protein
MKSLSIRDGTIELQGTAPEIWSNSARIEGVWFGQV